MDETKFEMHYKICGTKEKKSHQKHVPAENEDATWFECSICGYTSLYEIALKKHMAIKHVGVLPEQIHKCDICCKVYSLKCNLSSHKRKTHALLTTPVMPIIIK